MHENIDYQFQTFQINSATLNETRTINVFAPKASIEEPATFPTLYMLDGGLEEGFNKVMELVSKLIAEELFPKIILVGIENTNRNVDLTSKTKNQKDKKYVPKFGGAPKIRAFIAEELIPFINDKFATNGISGIMGVSLGGLFVLETLYFTPDLFDIYIAFDPTLWWNYHHILNLFTIKDQTERTFKYLWYAHSGIRNIYQLSLDLETIFSQNYATLKVDMNRNYAPNENHSTIFNASIEQALKACSKHFDTF